MAVVAEFSAKPLAGLSPLYVQFTDLSTGAPDTWLWDFGVEFDIDFLDTTDVIFLDTTDVVWQDYTYGEASADQNPSFIFEDVGVYAITLTASLAGDEDTMTKTNFILVITNIIARPSGLYSGVKEAYFNDGWENLKQFLVQQEFPHPCVIQYIDLFVDTTNE